MQDPPLHFEELCRYVGQLYLDSRHEIERLSLRARQAEQERDRLLASLKPAGKCPPEGAA